MLAARRFVRRIVVACGTVTIICFLFGTMARAQTQQQIDWCVNKDHAFSLDLAINGCTASIQSGRWSGKELAWAFNNRGNAYEDGRDYDHAIADYNEAIRLNPQYSNAFHRRGAVYQDKNDCDRAVADFNEAIRLNPKDANIFSDRSRCWRATGDLDRAIADLTQALKLNPKGTYPYRERGVILFSKGDFAAAAADLQRNIEDEKDANTIVYTMMYLFLSRARLGGTATAELEQYATRLKTKNWPYPVIELYLGRRAVDETLAAAVKPNDRCEADFYVGEWQLLQGNHEEARMRFKSAVDSCPRAFGEHLIASSELQRLGNSQHDH